MRLPAICLTRKTAFWYALIIVGELRLQCFQEWLLGLGMPYGIEPPAAAAILEGECAVAMRSEWQQARPNIVA